MKYLEIVQEEIETIEMDSDDYDTFSSTDWKDWQGLLEAFDNQLKPFGLTLTYDKDHDVYKITKLNSQTSVEKEYGPGPEVNPMKPWTDEDDFAVDEYLDRVYQTWFQLQGDMDNDLETLSDELRGCCGSTLRLVQGDGGDDNYWIKVARQ